MGDVLAAGRCRTTPASDVPNLFPTESSGVAKARRFCARCPIQDACLAYAIEHGEEYGIWGGVSETKRKEMIRLRRRELELVAA